MKCSYCRGEVDASLMKCKYCDSKIEVERKQLPITRLHKTLKKQQTA